MLSKPLQKTLGLMGPYTALKGPNGPYKLQALPYGALRTL